MDFRRMRKRGIGKRRGDGKRNTEKVRRKR
jgi:hypothetical protein